MKFITSIAIILFIGVIPFQYNRSYTIKVSKILTSDNSDNSDVPQNIEPEGGTVIGKT